METKNGWEEIPFPPTDSPQVEQLRRTGAQRFIKGDCRVILTFMDERGFGKEWHLSISCEDRYPTWDEIKDARYSLLPHSMSFAMILPPPGEYVNIHPNCFHLVECTCIGAR